MTIRKSRKWLWFFPAALAVAAIPAAVRLVSVLNQPAALQRPVVDAELDSAAEGLLSTVPHAGGKSGLVLDDGEREYLWQIEHHGLVLGRHGFEPLAEALSRGDQDALRNLLAPGFTGLIPDNPSPL